jgi:ligand-binding SRPBCC domain-containing protein
MSQRFSTEQWVPFAPALVFAFFANPENLPRLMPRWQKARIEEAVFAPPPPQPEGAPRFPGIAAGAGTRLTISARPFPLSPVRLPWEALIEDFRWNEGFCDIQLRGPFQSWRHCHSVRFAQNPETQQHGSVIRDEVEFSLRFAAMNPLVLPGLSYVFRYRQRRTLELLPRMAEVSGKGAYSAL